MVGGFCGDMCSVIREHKHPVALLPFDEKKCPFSIKFLWACGGLNEECSPQAEPFDHFVPCWWYCLGRFRRWSLVEESMSLWAALRVYSLTPLPAPSLLLCAWGWGCGLLVSCSCHYACHLLPCLPAMMDSTPSGTVNLGSQFPFVWFHFPLAST